MGKQRGSSFFRRVIIALGFFVLLSIFNTGSAFGIWIDSYLRKVNTAQVSSIKIVLMRFAEGSWRQVDILTGRFNGDGNLVEESRFTSEGVLQFAYNHSYDEDGSMIASTGRRMRQGKIINYNYRYRYDERGNQIESISDGSNDSVLSRYTARYDEKGNFTEGINYEGEEPVSKYVAEYDQRNNLLEESKYTPYRDRDELRYQLEYRHGYAYDLKKNLIEETRYSSDGALEYRYRYEYDGNDNLVAAISHGDDNAVLSRYEARYDHRNNLVESKKYDKDGKMTFWHTAEYDMANHLIREKNLLDDTSKVVYEAAYDAEGNLLEETHLGEDGLGGTGLDYRYSYCYDSRNNRTEETYHVFFSEVNRWKPISRQTNEISYKR